MGAAKNDPFKNPTLAEAVCEIHFDNGNEAFWKSDWEAVFKSKFQSNYPVFEQKQIRGFRAVLGPQGFNFSEKPNAIPRAVFKSKDGNLLRQVSPGMIAINELSKYRGWSFFSADIEDAWKVASEVIPSKEVVKMGLRYINRIPRVDASEQVGEWLKSSEFFPERLRKVSSRFINRFEDSMGDNTRLVVTVAEALEGDLRPIIFDIDIICEAKVTNDWKTISSALERLHNEAWNVFSSSIGNKLQTSLKGGAT